SKALGQIYPKPGWVEHDPHEIYYSQLEVLKTAIDKAGISYGEISAIGITNQRETVVLWDRNNGRPVYNAICWQCRRTADICAGLIRDGREPLIRERTGLIADAYFSGTKIKWILDNVPGVREEAAKGNILAGTIDSWLIWNLTGGKAHVTDFSNASRTMLFDIKKLVWDEELMSMLDIPMNIMPEVKPSSSLFGQTDSSILGFEVPITAVMGDQQSALFGHACFEKGDIKNTYGTGCFMLMNTGEEMVLSANRLLTTIAWGIDGKVSYALEGSIFVGGAVIQWLRDELGLISSAEECSALAETVPDTNGVYFVPAFTGLGTPYWDMYARGAVFGLTRGARKAHLARAALEAIAYQTRDVILCMQQDAYCSINSLKVDGGASVSGMLMQFQADVLGVKVFRPALADTTALGAAYMAGIYTGVWSGMAEISEKWRSERIYSPEMDREKVEKLYAGWKKAVGRALKWEDEA
ncbi:MAG: glycerol kinase GlpK, partial [Clostridiales bacterium]|nr:glycerol kinase GlpK [Clostridiales bacterium]